MSYRSTLIVGLAAVGGLAAILMTGAFAASGADNARAPRAFTVQLVSRNGSNMTGTARFVPRGPRSFVVVVTVRGGPGGGPTGYPAHVHTGPCSKEPTFANPRIRFGLVYVRSGRSRTIVNRSLAVFRRRVHSLNVHEPSGALRPMACGDLPLRF